MKRIVYLADPAVFSRFVIQAPPQDVESGSILKQMGCTNGASKLIVVQLDTKKNVFLIIRTLGFESNNRNSNDKTKLFMILPPSSMFSPPLSPEEPYKPSVIITDVECIEPLRDVFTTFGLELHQDGRWHKTTTDKIITAKDEGPRAALEALHALIEEFNNVTTATRKPDRAAQVSKVAVDASWGLTVEAMFPISRQQQKQIRRDHSPKRSGKH